MEKSTDRPVTYVPWPQCIHLSVLRRLRDVKYLHKSCNKKKKFIHKMKNATSCISSQSTVYNIKKKRKKIRLHKSIFIYFFILLFCSFLFSFSSRKLFFTE